MNGGVETALVIGATLDIGRAIARTLAEELATLHGCTGTITGACSDPSGMCPRLHSRHTTTTNCMRASPNADMP